MSILRFSVRELSVFDGPLHACDRQQRKPRLAQQAARDGRLAMDEFGAGFRRVAELSSRKRMDAPTAPVSRLQYGHSLARAGEFAGGHQACGACADDDDLAWMHHRSAAA